MVQASSISQLPQMMCKTVSAMKIVVLIPYMSQMNIMMTY
jgi:hypothetical protein